MKSKDSIAKTPLSQTWCFLIYLSLAGILTVSHRHWIDKPFEKERHEMHEKVLQKTAPAPIQYRIMTPYLSEALQRLGFSFRASFVAIRFFFTALCGILLHLFMRKWFEDVHCLLGTLYFYACLPLTHLHYYLQPMDAPNLAFMIVAFFLIRERRDLWLALLSGLAMLNRETFVLVPLVWLLYRWDELPLAQTVLRFLAFCAVTLGVYFALRSYYGNAAYYSEAYFLRFNAASLESYFYFGLMFGALSWMAFKDWKSKPKFMRRASLFVPFFVAFHFMVTIFQEPRLMLPLFPILIPMALASLVPPGPDPEPMIRAPSWLLKVSPVLYGLTFIVFVSLTHGFAFYLEKAHVSPWRDKIRAAQMYGKEGYALFEKGAYAEAEKIWQRGLEAHPRSFDLHYNLGYLYAHHLNNPTKAQAHWRMCLEIEPSHPQAHAIRQELERLKKAQ